MDSPSQRLTQTQNQDGGASSLNWKGHPWSGQRLTPDGLAPCGVLNLSVFCTIDQEDAVEERSLLDSSPPHLLMEHFSEAQSHLEEDPQNPGRVLSMDSFIHCLGGKVCPSAKEAVRWTSHWQCGDRQVSWPLRWHQGCCGEGMLGHVRHV